MTIKTKIEWTENTWNPWHGCHKVSEECRFCYMFRDKKRYGQDPNVVTRSKSTFYDPLKWTDPTLIFTCSWSDFFIKEADEWRDEAFAIMALTPQHTYQILTKRPDRMLEYMRSATEPEEFGATMPDNFRDVGYLMSECFMQRRDNPAIKQRILSDSLPANGQWEWCSSLVNWPLPNVWLGISAGDQETADERIPLLLQTPAALRFLSLEPLLGPIDLRGKDAQGSCLDPYENDPKIDWVITGGESGGKGVRPTKPEWVRSLRDQCIAADVPFFFKQWGEYAPASNIIDMLGASHLVTFANGVEDTMRRVGKKNAGRTLDGLEWSQMPELRK